MRELEGVGQQYEQFVRTLDANKEVTLADVEARKEIARAQADAVGTALASANVDIVGGADVFVDRVIGAVTSGRQVDAVVNGSETLSKVAVPYLNGEKDILGLAAGAIAGLGSEGMANLTLAGVLTALAGRLDSDTASGLGEIVEALKAKGLDQIDLATLAASKGELARVGVADRIRREMTTTPDAPGGASSYDLLVGRLRETGAALRSDAAVLNDQRAEVFAARPMTLAEAERFRTETPPPRPTSWWLATRRCRARSGGQRQAGGHRPVHALPPSAGGRRRLGRAARRAGSPGWFLADPSFGRDFEELVTYYADTRVAGLRIVDDSLLMVFRIGDELSDVRVLRWRLADGEAHYLDAYGEVPAAVPDDVEWVTVGREAIGTGRDPVLDLHGLVLVDLVGGELVARVPDPVSGSGWCCASR